MLSTVALYGQFLQKSFIRCFNRKNHCSIGLRRREVAEVAGVTEVTIRNRYKELAEKLDIGIIQ